ncbi:MAG: twin-arginine translocation protein TatB subunit [Hyphomicrobiales bacterium]|nr:twin-arginine translocation protein TatB subunit [Hyphomicrobiales bacterium]
MFDFDAGKLIVIGLVALIVIGPKELPRVLRQVGQAIGKLRRMAADFQGQFMDAMREADIEDIRKEVAKVGESAKLDVNFDPVGTMRNEIGGAIEKSNIPHEADYTPPVEPTVPVNVINMPDLPDTAPAATESTIAAAIAPVTPEAAQAAAPEAPARSSQA